MSSFGKKKKKKRNAENNSFPDDINLREMFRVYETRGKELYRPFNVFFYLWDEFVSGTATRAKLKASS